jgi:hypothetical protein
MIDTGALISRLRSQHLEIAHRAADVIESLVASEAEAREMIDEVLAARNALLASLPVEERDLILALTD